MTKLKAVEERAPSCYKENIKNKHREHISPPLSKHTYLMLWYVCVSATCTHPFTPTHPSNHPMFLTYILLSLMALFKSYPCVGDVTIPLALLPLWTHTFRCELHVYYSIQWNLQIKDALGAELLSSFWRWEVRANMQFIAPSRLIHLDSMY